MSSEVTSGNAFGARYRVHARTGTVDTTETRSETEVSGQVSGGGGYSSGGTGFTAPVSGSIKSKTTRFQNIFLTDEDGQEHNIELVNFLVPCKQGQKLTMLLLTSGDSDSGSYFRAYNHNTREHCNHPKGVISEMFPWLMFMIAMAAVLVFMLYSASTSDDAGIGGVIFLTVFALAIASIVFGAIGWIFAYVRSIRVRSDANLKRYVASLGSA